MSQTTHGTTRVHESTSAALIHNALLVSVLLALVGMALAITAGVLGLWLVGADAGWWAFVLILAGFALGLAALLKNAWDSARWMLVETIAADIAERNAHAKRVDAEAEKMLAEADRVDAESNALKLAAENAAQLNMNTGSGKMTVKNQPIKYKVGGRAVGQLNLAQTAEVKVRKVEITGADVRWFAEQLAEGYGHSKSKWHVNDKDKILLPYSRQPVTYAIYKAVMDALAESNPPALAGRGERSSGTLIDAEPAELVKLIEQTYPGAGSKGITLELPAST